MKNRLLHLLGKVLLLSLLATACHKETAQPDPAPDKLIMNFTRMFVLI